MSLNLVALAAGHLVVLPFEARETPEGEGNAVKLSLTGTAFWAWESYGFWVWELSDRAFYAPAFSHRGRSIQYVRRQLPCPVGDNYLDRLTDM